MRSPIGWLLPHALLLTALPASAAERGLEVGCDLAVLMRQEASANRSSLPQIGARASFGFSRNLALAAGYTLAFSSDGTAAAVSSQYHRFLLRPELTLPAAASRLVVAAGPVLGLAHTTFYEGGSEAASLTVARLGVSAGAAVEVRIGRVLVRAFVDVIEAARRLDVAAGLGAGFSWEPP